MYSNKNELNLQAMAVVETCSKNLNTLSWLWGGFTVDIYENRILREHDDLDYLTLNLHKLTPQFIVLFENCGWQAGLLENGDLKLQREGIKIHLGHVEISKKARWTHNGDKGSLWFPQDWLKSKPVNFCGLEIHVVEPEFQYVMLERPQLLNPDWRYREKDLVARKYLRSFLEGKGVAPQSLFGQVSDIWRQPA